MPSVTLQGSHREQGTGAVRKVSAAVCGQRALPLLCWARRGRWPGRGCPWPAVLVLLVSWVLGHRYFTCLCSVDLRWPISESSCCAVLAWTLPVLWSSPVVSVPGWQGGLSSCKGCSLPLTLFCQPSKQCGVFPKTQGSRGSVSSLSL